MTRRRANNTDTAFPLSLPQTPAEYLDILRFRWYWILIGLLVGAVGSQIVVRFVPKRYVSETVVLVDADRIPKEFVPRITTQDARDRLRTIHEEILARPQIERVLDDLNPYPEMIDVPRAQIVELIRSRTGIALRGRDAFVLQYTDTDPDRAQLMASRLASLFIENATGDQAAQALDANQFIEGQLEQTRRDLERIESRLGVVKTRNMGMLPNQLEANLSTLQRMELERQSVEAQIRAAKDRKLLLERQLALQSQMNEPEAQLIPALPSGGGTEPASEPSTLAQMKLHLAQLRTRYTDVHPEVQATLARIERLEREEATLGPDTPPPAPAPPAAVPSDPFNIGADLANSITSAPSRDPGEEVSETPAAGLPPDIMLSDLRAQVAAAERDIELMQARYAQVQQRIAEYQTRVERIPAVEQELQSLERDYELISKYYSELLSRKLQAETAGAVERKWQAQFSIIDPAQVPESAEYPSAYLFLLAGTAVGLGAGVLGAFLLEALDPSVKNLRELENLLPYPVLMTLPKVKEQRRATKQPGPTPPVPPSDRGDASADELSAAS